MAETYYKATHPDGTDFRTGIIDYAGALVSGKVVRHPIARKVFDVPSTYLSVSVSATDCTGFSWPCRLFRVEPVGRTMGAGRRRLSASPNKRAVSALRVVEELPAHLVFGPNGEQVVALIERAVRLTPDEVSRLATAWDAAWSAAWNAARGAGRDAGRDAARYAARGAAWEAAWEAARYAAWGAAWDAARDAAGSAARNAAWDAASWLLISDLPVAERCRVLYEPWRSVLGDYPWR